MRSALKWLKAKPAYRQIDGGAVGLCLKNVRYAFDIPAKYDTAANAAKHQTLYPGFKANSAPADRPYFWSGGSHGFGHIAITDGYTKVGKNLRVWTTDWPSPITGRADGKWRRVRVDTITKRWGMTPLGWSKELNGVKIDV